MVNAGEIGQWLRSIGPHLFCCGHVHAAWAFRPEPVPNQLCINAGAPLLRSRTRSLPPGFLEILPFLPESTTEKTIIVSLWAEKRDAERYEREAYPKVAEIVKPYLTTAITFKQYVVETSVSPNFMESFVA